MPGQAVLDHTALPQLIDDILANAHYSVLLAFRGTSHQFQARIDADLFHHIIAREHDYEEDIPPDMPIAEIAARPTPSNVELRTASGRRLPGVRWEDEDASDAERLHWAARIRRYTRCVDFSNDVCLDNQEPVRDAALLADPEVRRILEEHDRNLLRWALGNVQRVRRWDMGTIFAMGADTIVQFAHAETSWDGYMCEPGALFDDMYVEPLDKLVINLRYDPGIGLLEQCDFGHNTHRHRTNSFNRRRNRIENPRELVVIFGRDRRYGPDTRFGGPGKVLDGLPEPEEDAPPLGLLHGVVEFLGSKLHCVERIVLVGLESVERTLLNVSPGIAEARLHDKVRKAIRVESAAQEDDLFDEEENLCRLALMDERLAQWQFHPEFDHFAVTEYWEARKQELDGDFRALNKLVHRLHTVTAADGYPNGLLSAMPSWVNLPDQPTFASIHFMTHDEYRVRYGQETWDFETDGYEID
ncbi:hypothetical protein CspeluHIS016_0111560 [Cutaneotrichosporon spelunceum]|uniref:Uncharacterized protein n=1 Tax=Cutaneotrichosporon spelunceum TaxID=1672016 RepID=A0AAD3TPR9_9TREE|nr:hypothetical protein CspeluHIS016_0111560 [Cutaneotrichosporon spelunceum]